MSDTLTSDAFDFGDVRIENGKIFLGGIEVPSEGSGDLPETFDQFMEQKKREVVGDAQSEQLSKLEDDGEEEAPPEAAKPDDDGEKEAEPEAAKPEEPEEAQVAPPLEIKIKFNGEELTLSGEDEIRSLAQKGKLFDQKNEQMSEMRLEIEPFYALNMKLKDDPEFLDYVKNYGNSEYIVDGPQPRVVTEAQINQSVSDKVAFLLEGEKAKWAHDAKYGPAEGIPKASDVHSQMLQDSFRWDKFTREWVDSNPRAYQEKFTETFQKMCAERGVVPDAAPVAPPKQAQPGDVRDALKQKEVAKESARVPGVQTTRPVPADDGRRAYNKAVKQARMSGDIDDLARAIALSGSLPI